MIYRNFAVENKFKKIMRLKIIAFILLSLFSWDFVGEASVGGATKNSYNSYKVELKDKKIRPRDNSQKVECYFYSDGKLLVKFPSSEGWADLVVSTPMGELVHKERFHTGFEFSTYIGVPDMPWKIEVTTTQGGEYEGWLIVQE